MFKKGDKVTYITNVDGTVSNYHVIEQELEATVVMTSKSFGDMGPFTMTFNKHTGEGVGDYIGTRIIKCA